MTNKQYVLDALRETTEDVKRVNADAKSIIKLSIEKWTSVIKNNDDVLSSLFGLRKELIKIAYRKCTPGILVALTESSTHKIFTFKLNTASEHIECMVESAEHSTEPELFSVIIGNKPNGYSLTLTWNGAYAQSVTVNITRDSVYVDDLPRFLTETKSIDILSDMHNNSYGLYDVLHIHTEDIIKRLIDQIKWYTNAAENK